MNTLTQSQKSQEQVVFKQAQYFANTLGRQRHDAQKLGDLPEKTDSELVNSPEEKSLDAKREDKQEETEEKVYTMARKNSQVLYTTSTVFPFDFFPDKLTINANKIDVVKSEFFGSHQATSVPLRDIATVEVQTTPFFATLRIVNIRYPMQPILLQYLKKDDANKAKRIIDGLLVAVAHGADVAAIEPKRFLQEIEIVGSSAGPQ